MLPTETNVRNKRMKAIDEDTASVPPTIHGTRLRNSTTTKGVVHIIWRNFGNGIRRADIQERNNRDQP